MTDTIVETLRTYVRANQARYVTELRALVSQPSVSATGEGVPQCAALVQGLMERAGLCTQAFTTDGYSHDNPLLYGEYGAAGAGPTIALYAHYDIVPPADPERWSVPLYDPVIKDGRLYGAGVADDKAQLFTIIKAIEALAQAGVSAPALKVVSDGEEEQYSPHFESFMAQHRDLFKADLLLGVDGEAHETGPVLALGLKGTLFVRLDVQTAAKDLFTGYSPVVPNAIWRLNQALASLVDRNGRILMGGFYDAVAPLSAVEEAWLAQVPFDRPGILRHLQTQRLLVHDGADYYRRLTTWPTCAITSISGGYHGAGVKNVLPGTASATVDFQIVANQTCDDLEAKLRRHFAQHGFEDVQVTVLQRRGPHKIASDHPYVEPVRAGARRAYGIEPVMLPYYRGAGGVGAEFQGIGVPSIWLPTLYPMENNMGGTDENVRVQDVLDGIVAIAVICHHLCQAR